ncbi:MAG: GNAT family N-acetyltransferase [Clostridia bacterium]|nr:GNAT family N-acetyltransferase [Clostridia bacterium]
MKIRKAKIQDTQQIYSLTQDTILTAYKNAYTQYEIDFFCDLHSEENIADDIAKGIVYVLTEGNEILATATLDGNHVMRVFVEKSHMGQGFGSKIMDFVEGEIAKNYGESVLDTSLVAKEFYLRRGYVYICSESLDIKDGKRLKYDILKKVLTEGKI